MLIKKQKVILMSQSVTGVSSSCGMYLIRCRLTLTVQFEWQPCCDLKKYILMAAVTFFLILTLSSICCLSGYLHFSIISSVFCNLVVIPHLGFLFRIKYIFCALVTLYARDLWAIQY